VENISSKAEGIRLPAVDRALDLLELLAGSPSGVKLAEISRRLDIPKSTAHYLIHTLLSRDYIRRNANGRTYIIGPRTAGLAGMTEAERQLRMVTGAELRSLTDRLKLISLVAGLKGAQRVLIGLVIPSGGEERGAWPGHHADLHCTALGKALIAHLSNSELTALLSNRPLAKFTANTICSLPQLQKHLAAVRTSGYAVNNEEHISGVRGVAAPVFNQAGKVMASVGVVGSTSELPRWRVPTIGHELIAVAATLSRKTMEGMPLEA
jgi:DNA-binding IclR family transcriptional regulator